jgi:candicidin polyketide synthase FscB
MLLPFAWTGVSLHAAGAPALRARLRRTAGGWSLQAADAAGAPVITVQSLALRPVRAADLQAGGGTARRPVHHHLGPGPGRPGRGAGAGPGRDQRARWPRRARHPRLPGPGRLAAAVAAGQPAPQDVLACAGRRPRCGGRRVPATERAGLRRRSRGCGGPAAAARAVTGRVLGLVQGFLEPAELAVPAGAGHPGRGRRGGGRGGGRPGRRGGLGPGPQAQSENPGRLVLADLPADTSAP